MENESESRRFRLPKPSSKESDSVKEAVPVSIMESFEQRAHCGHSLVQIGRTMFPCGTPVRSSRGPSSKRGVSSS